MVMHYTHIWSYDLVASSWSKLTLLLDMTRGLLDRTRGRVSIKVSMTALDQGHGMIEVCRDVLYPYVAI